MKTTWIIISLLAAASTLAPAATGAIRITADTPWVVAADEPEPVARALADVQRDWYKVLGHRPVMLKEPPKAWQGPVLYLGSKGPWLADMIGEPVGGAETFVLRVQRDPSGRPAVLATGADVRGAIYAAYTLSEELLGVDPWYFWTDHEPALQEAIEVPSDLNERFGPATFRYRGWFINDEDLLGEFAPDPLRENPYSLEMLDRICETLLRLRGNMIVPGTFNFPDERCWELASRRGLALNMHHIQVVGLNTFRWPKDLPFSHTKHPEVMEKYWRDCIAAFKGREVVWTVGYRGKHDRPFWTDEPELKTSEARGAVITKAIARQVELIREADPKGMIIANLWMEGAEMMHAGHLKLPAEVVTVWPDDGSGMIRDNGSVSAGQGIYYHTAMMNGGANQLSEAVNPARIYGELARFQQAGATNYFLVNVSDVRPVPLSTDCAMRFAWNAAPYRGRTAGENMAAFLADWSRRQFGVPLAAEVAALYACYFDIPYQRQDVRNGEHRLHTMLRIKLAPAATLAIAGKPLTEAALAAAREVRRFAGDNLGYVTDLANSAAQLAARVPAERRDFYQAHVLTPIQIHQRSLEMLDFHSAALVAYGSNDKAQAIASAEQALRACDGLFGALRRAETVKWAAWYRGDSFTDVEASRERLRALLAALRGEAPPPTRPRLDYGNLYQYQEPFLKNFPRLYPKSDPQPGSKP
jgi:hypothetical protein